MRPRQGGKARCCGGSAENQTAKPHIGGGSATEKPPKPHVVSGSAAKQPPKPRVATSDAAKAPSRRAWRGRIKKKLIYFIFLVKIICIINNYDVHLAQRIFN